MAQKRITSGYQITNRNWVTHEPIQINNGNRKQIQLPAHLMKNNTLMMCVVAALVIFTSPVDAAKVVNQSIPISLSVPVPCVGEVVDLSGRLHTVITFT